MNTLLLNTKMNTLDTTILVFPNQLFILDTVLIYLDITVFANQLFNLCLYNNTSIYVYKYGYISTLLLSKNMNTLDKRAKKIQFVGIKLYKYGYIRHTSKKRYNLWVSNCISILVNKFLKRPTILY